jgi:pimeloyl-ACP methyl ester carboxylesterase
VYYRGGVLIHWPLVLVSAVLFLAILLTLGYAYERIAARRDARIHPAPGRLIPVSGRNVHLLCKGMTTPIVVIEQGAGELSRFWWPLQDEAAKFARVCSYDRAGFGWSDPVREGRTIGDRAAELRLLLMNAGVPGPYIFVAHSFGGLIVRAYTERYPSEVDGLVLVDTPEEDSLFQPDVLNFYSKIRAMNRIVALAARFGILRLLRHWIPLERYGFWLAGPEEYLALCDDLASLERVPEAERSSKPAGSLGALPLIVITHGKPFPGPFAVLERNWSEGQSRLAALSTDSCLIVAENSNHMIQQDEPELVLDAIRRVHACVSGGRRLK